MNCLKFVWWFVLLKYGTDTADWIDITDQYLFRGTEIRKGIQFRETETKNQGKNVKKSALRFSPMEQVLIRDINSLKGTVSRKMTPMLLYIIWKLSP
jgi:hypothetical protein